MPLRVENSAMKAKKPALNFAKGAGRDPNDPVFSERQHWARDSQDDGRMSVVAGYGGDMQTTAVKLTYDDYVLFPDDGMRHELIDGVHYVTPSPNLRHQRISGQLYLELGIWLRAHPVGQLFYAPVDVVFTRYDVVVPDLLFVSNERASDLLNEQHALGADLIIEIASPGTRKRDRTIKRQLYERAGVSEYWIVDPAVDSIRVHRLDGEVFGKTIELTCSAGDLLATPLLPGLKLPLERIFRE